MMGVFFVWVDSVDWRGVGGGGREECVKGQVRGEGSRGQRVGKGDGGSGLRFLEWFLNFFNGF